MAFDDYETDKQLQALTADIAKTYQDAYDDLSREAAKYWADFKPRYIAERKAFEAGKGGYSDEATAKSKFDAWYLSQIGRGERWDTLRDKMAKRVTEANKTAAAYINDKTPGIYALNSNYTAYLIEQATGVDFTIYDERTVADLIQGKTQILPMYRTGDADSMRRAQKQLTNAVTSGILQGQPIDKIAQQFERVTDMNRNAAVRNARTAVTAAQNAGRQDTYERAQDMGIQLEKEWIATEDDRTRESHAELDGVRVKIDETYPNGLNFPGDPAGDPGEVYNCRCTQRAIIPKYNGQARETRIEGHEGAHDKASYKKWLDDKRAAKMDQAPRTHADATARAMEAAEDRKNDKFNYDNAVIASHFTSKEAAEDIRENGFDLSKAGSNAGSIWGDAVYLTDSKLEKAFYSNRAGAAEVKVYADTSDMLKVTLDGSFTVNKMYNEAAKSFTAEELKEYKNAVKQNKNNNEFLPEKKAFIETVEKHYPGMVIEQDNGGMIDPLSGGNQIVIYDLEKLRVKK